MDDSSMENVTRNYEYYMKEFEVYYTPLLAIFGTVGNLLSVYVFFNTKLRKLSSSYYLAALAIFDSIFLISLFIVWLDVVGVNWFNLPVMCQTMIYFAYVCSFLSVWLVIAFTIERFVAVKYPLLRQSICTTSRAKSIVLVLIFVAMLLYSPLTVFTEVRYEKERGKVMCTNDPQWLKADNIFHIFDTVIVVLIPVLIITILNTLICRAIWKLSNVRKRLMERGSDTKATQKTKGVSLRKIRKTKASVWSQNKITKMLLIVSTVCLLMNLPSYVLRIWGKIVSKLL